MTAFSIKTKQFEGPLDLLLSLIEKEKLDVTQMSLARVADEYVEYINTMQIGPEEIADFLVVAARLLLIKSRQILPSLRLTEEEEESTQDLKAALAEYKKIKMAAIGLAALLDKKQHLWTRPVSASATTVFSPPTMTPKDLAGLVHELVAQLPDITLLDEGKIEATVSLEEKMDHVRGLLSRVASLDFSKLAASGASKTDIIVTFLAVLELTKQRFVTVEQVEPFGAISLSRPEASL